MAETPSAPILFGRILSDEEMFHVERYLLEKWVRSPYGQFPTAPTSALTGRAGLTLAAGGRLTCADDLAFSDMTLTFDIANVTAISEPLLSVAGSLTLSNVRAEFLNYTSLTPRVFHKFLSVGGTRTGDFVGDNLVRGWVRTPFNHGEAIGRTRGLVLFVR